MQPLTAPLDSKRHLWRRFFNNGRALGIAGLALTCLPIIIIIGVPFIWLLVSADAGWPYAFLYGIVWTVLLLPVLAPVTVNLVAIRLGPAAVKCGKAGLTLGLLGVLYISALLYFLN